MSANKKNVLVVGLNPAWQVFLDFPSLTLGEVNRAQKKLQGASGKGLNVCQILQQLLDHPGSGSLKASEKSRIGLLQILGGKTGRAIAKSCRERGIENFALWQKIENRTCYTIHENGTHQVTECIEPFTLSPTSPSKKATQKVIEKLSQGGYGLKIVSGSFPALTPQWLRDHIGQCAPQADLFLDTLECADTSLLNQARWLKINEAEWKSLIDQGKINNKTFKFTQILITRGPEPALAALTKGKGMYSCFEVVLPHSLLPAQIRPEYPIGAGDAVLAGLVWASLQKWSVQECIGFGLCAGVASCTQPLPGVLDVSLAHALWKSYKTQARFLPLESNHPLASIFR